MVVMTSGQAQIASMAFITINYMSMIASQLSMSMGRKSHRCQGNNLNIILFPIDEGVQADTRRLPE